MEEYTPSVAIPNFIEGNIPKCSRGEERERSGRKTHRIIRSLEESRGAGGQGTLTECSTVDGSGVEE